MPLPLQIPADHPAFEGHFPGNPLLPGVVLLDVAVRTAGAVVNGTGADRWATADSWAADRWEIVSAKFHNVVRPGEPLSVEHQPQPNQTLRFTIRRADEVVASGVLKLLSHESTVDGQ